MLSTKMKSASYVVILVVIIALTGVDGNYNYNTGSRNNTSQISNAKTVETKCTMVLGEKNTFYENRVRLDNPITYVFTIPRDYIRSSHVSEQESQQTTNLRIEVGTDTKKSTLRYPVMFAIRQQKIISTLEVPSKPEDGMAARISPSYRNTSQIFYHAGRTLCIDNDGTVGTRGTNVTVRVSTQSSTFLDYHLILRLTTNFQIPIGKEMTLEVSPTTPRFFGFSFSRPDLSQVSIRATSNSSDCMTISVQSAECPIYDLERNVRYQGLWQTMSTRAAMSVQKAGWFKNGFVLVFVTHTDKSICGRKDLFSGTTSANASRVINTMGFGDYQHFKDPYAKTIKLMIMDESRIPGWIIFLCLLIPLIATFGTALAVLGLFRNRHEWMAKILLEKFGDSSTSDNLILNETVSSQANEDESNIDARSMVAEMLLNEIMEDTTSSINSLRRGRRTHASPSPVQGKRGDHKTGSGCRWKADLYIADFKCKQYHEVKKFAKRFYWTIAIVAIFYSIPVYQLVLHYLRVLYRTGEYDICYYNYLCAQRLGLLIDFNHFWSNASYIIFGILFISIVRRRSRNLCLPEHHKNHQKDDTESIKGGCWRCCCRSSGGSNSHGKVFQICFCTFSKICFRWDHGVPAHFGVFYALGVALTMEGFLSAAYHLCPNQSTFQFDTCFMYVIAVLLLMKIYQFRHPVHFGANHTFAILAGFVVVSVVGLLFEQGTDTAILLFKSIFLPVQYIITILLIVYYYAVGYVKDGNDEIITDWRIYTNLGQLKSQRINGDRLILPLISLSICVAVLVYTELAKIGFASYLLYLLVGNVLGTTLYYVGIMKPLHGEFKNRTWVQPVLYFLASGIIGGFSLQYFVRAPAQWELSASASRAENEDCLTAWFPFHPFYDSHDAWHFLSAGALFLAFMGLLIVDDDLITTPQHEIPVF